MRQAICTVALVLGLTSAAAAQDGGKLNWKGHSDPKSAMLDARDQGKPIMLYFTSAG